MASINAELKGSEGLMDRSRSLNRRHFVALGSALTVGTWVSQSFAGTASSWAGPMRWQGGLAASARIHPRIRKLYYDFFFELHREGLLELTAAPREGGFTKNFGYYFKHDIVQFGVVSGRLNRYNPGLEDYALRPPTESGQFFDRDAQLRRRWSQAYAKFNVVPFVFAESAEPEVYFERQETILSKSRRLVLAPAEDMARLQSLGYAVQAVETLQQMVTELRHPGVDMTCAMPLSIVLRMQKMLKAQGIDVSQWRLSQNPSLFPEEHFEMLIQQKAWQALTPLAQRRFAAVVERIRTKSRRLNLSEITLTMSDIPHGDACPLALNV